MNAQLGLTIATNNGVVGGGEVMLAQLAETARNLGVRARIAAPTTPGDVLDQARTDGFDVAAIRAHDRASYMRGLRAWDRTRSGVLWCNGLVPAMATAGHRERVVHLHQQPHGLQRLARMAAVRGVSEVIVPSGFMGSIVPHTRVLPNWTADPSHPPMHPARPGPVVGFLGRVTLEKGVDVLARAVELLHRRGRPLQVVLAGEPRFESARDVRTVDAAVERLGDNVHRIGWVSPSALFELVDLAVFPSVWPEPFGLVAAEAMAARAPFVISDAGALTEVAGPQHPWVARAGDAEDLANTIARALDASDAERDLAVEAAYERWDERFSPRSGQRQLAAVLQHLGFEVPAIEMDTA